MNINRTWWKAAFVRALRTVAQTAVATIGTAALIERVNWLAVLSASALAGILSLLTSLAGLPEVDADKGRITMMAYDEYDEDGNPVVQGECETCDLSAYLDEDAKEGGDAE